MQSSKNGLQLRNAVIGFVAVLAVYVLGVSGSNHSASGQGINSSSTIQIDYVAATVYGDYIMVYGHVSDTDGSVVGNIVNVDGDISGSTEVGTNGNFAFVVPANSPYGTFTAQATDGVYSSPVKTGGYSA